MVSSEGATRDRRLQELDSLWTIASFMAIGLALAGPEGGQGRTAQARP